MVGDERDRICQKCGLHVYNTSEMTTAEVEELIEKPQERVCALVYRRRDGTILTKDCPVGLSAAWNWIEVTAGAIFTLIMGLWTFSFAQGQLASSISAAFSSVVTQLGQLEAAPSGVYINPEQAKVSAVNVSLPGYSRDLLNFEGHYQREALRRGDVMAGVRLVNPSAEDIAVVAGNPSVEDVNLFVSYLDSDMLSSLRALKGLRHLSISTGWDAIHPLPQSLGLTNVSDISLTLVPNLFAQVSAQEDQLLRAMSRDTTNRSFSVLNNDPYLPYVQWVGTLDAALIPNDENISSLLVACQSMTNVSALEKIKHLERLQLNVHAIERSDLSSIGKLNSLEEFGFYCDTFDESTFDELLKVPNSKLRIVSVYNPSKTVLKSLCEWSEPRTLTAEATSLAGPVVSVVRGESIQVMDTMHENSILPAVIQSSPWLNSVRSTSSACAAIIRDHWTAGGAISPSPY
jgi:hypothetical protein